MKCVLVAVLVLIVVTEGLWECAWTGEEYPCDGVTACSYGCYKDACWSQCNGVCSKNINNHICNGCKEWCYVEADNDYGKCREHADCKEYRTNSCWSTCTV
ncbi:uncharacterized protein LOC134820590 [Bolinopsis microptera]|uniref:uncharacterized protein LOC134820590 n=1 Tax=Bolinopsis microptera TaxID=2820187 RepID=UPI003079FE4E